MKKLLFATVLVLMSGSSLAHADLLVPIVLQPVFNPDGDNLVDWTYHSPNGVSVAVSYSVDTTATEIYNPAYDNAVLYPGAIIGSTFGSLMFRFDTPVIGFGFNYVLFSNDSSPMGEATVGAPLVFGLISGGSADIDWLGDTTVTTDPDNPGNWIATGRFEYTSSAFTDVTLLFSPIKGELNPDTGGPQYNFQLDSPSFDPVPEPGSLILTITGLALVAFGRSHLRKGPRG